MSLAIGGGVEGVPDGDAGVVALRVLLRVRSDMMGITEGHERMADMEIESELDIWSRAGDFGRRIIAERMVLGRATEISDGVSDGDKHNSDGTNEISGGRTPRAQYYMEISEGVSDDRSMRR